MKKKGYRIKTIGGGQTYMWKKYDVTQNPTYVFLDSKNKVLRRRSGALNAGQLKNFWWTFKLKNAEAVSPSS